MKQRWMVMVAVAMVMACVRPTGAMSEGYVVTKATQGEIGVEFTLSAVRLSKAAISVEMAIPVKGKLQHLKSVELRIGQGAPLLSATLEAKPDKNGTRVVQFQIAPELAEKCSIDLVVATVPVNGLDYEHFYAVELKGYITAAK